MLTIGIDPVAFSIGSFAVRWYGIMVAVAVIVLLVVTFLETKRLGISPDIIYGLFLWGIIGGIIGARLVHVIDYWDYYVAHPGEIVGFAGLALYGAIIGALLAVFIYTRVKKVSFSSLAGVGDAIAVGAPLAQAVGRAGCTINGCCYGILAPNLPWAVVYTHPDSYAPLGVPMHATQIYFLLWNLIVFGVVWKMRRQLKPQGSLFLLYLALYAAGDFGLRFFRVNDPFLFGLHEGQVTSLAILVVVIPLLIIKVRRFQQKALIAGPAGEINQPGESREG
jgi:phosphatidylglycerol:prolipoprotein diacylglycerol transferase